MKRIGTDISDCSPKSEWMRIALFEKTEISIPNANNQQVFLWQVYLWPLHLVAYSLVKEIFSCKQGFTVVNNSMH